MADEPREPKAKRRRVWTSHKPPQYPTPVPGCPDRFALARANPHKRDAFVRMDEKTHKYYFHGRPVGTSVTAFLTAFFPKFDAREACARMLRNPSFPTHSRYEDYRGLHLVSDDGSVVPDAADRIIAAWDAKSLASREEGTALHADLEARCNATTAVGGVQIDDITDASSPELQQFAAYARSCRERGLVPYRTEQKLLDVGLDIAGSVDMQWTFEGAQRTDPDTGRVRVVVADWKRSPNLLKPVFYGERGFGPMRDFPACASSKYELQLGLYRALLEAHYGVVVVSMEVVAFHPGNGSPDRYVLFPVTIERDTVKAVMDVRRDQLEDGLTVDALRNAMSAPDSLVGV